LLLDEPLSALDARIRKHLREQIRQIQRELGLTTIFVTHDQEEALTMSDRIFLMNQGKIVQSGDAETLYTAPVDVFAAGFIGNYNLLDADSPRSCCSGRSATASRFARSHRAEPQWRTGRTGTQPQPAGQRDPLPDRSPGWNWWWMCSTARRPICIPTVSAWRFPSIRRRCVR
jgi:ABC-type sugar transport system ATPase subunit